MTVSIRADGSKRDISINTASHEPHCTVSIPAGPLETLEKGVRCIV